MARGNNIEAIVFRKKNNNYEFLLLRRTAERGGFWQPVTGGIEEDETKLDAVKREVEEEIGVKNILKIIDEIYSFILEGNNKEEFVFGVEIGSNEKIVLDKNVSLEHEEYKWCKFEEALDLLKWKGNKEGLTKLNFILKKEK
jgi:dihydroneopterin triphosphate diphosphatase